MYISNLQICTKDFLQALYAMRKEMHATSKGQRLKLKKCKEQKRQENKLSNTLMEIYVWSNAVGMVVFLK